MNAINLTSETNTGTVDAPIELLFELENKQKVYIVSTNTEYKNNYVWKTIPTLIQNHEEGIISVIKKTKNVEENSNI